MKRRLLPLLSAPLLAVAMAAPAAAAAGPSAPAVPPAWANWTPAASPAAKPSALAGFFNSAGPDSSMSYNSTGGAITSTTTGTGAYTVDFAGLSGITGGNVEVSSLAPSATCSVQYWYPNGADLDVLVDCYDYSGNPADGTFSLAVTQPTRAPRGALAYDWNYKPTKSYTPTGSYQYNSARKKNHITHLGKGRYEVTMPKVGASGGSGTVKVSAYGSGGGDCQLLKWGSTAARTERIWVDCYSATGARQNRDFDVLYAASTNILGQNGMTGANALADKPGVAAYLPANQWSSRRGAKVDIVEVERPLLYYFIIAGIGAGSNPNGGGGNMQVTAQSSHYVHCVAADWTPGYSANALVGCVNNAGKLVKAAYTVQWVNG